jgi:triosephosphate isomerase
MRKKIVAGNWKMNTGVDEAFELISSIENLLDENDLPENLQIVIAPPFIHIKMLNDVLENNSSIKIGAQNCHQEEKGAFTGEVSASMIRSTGAEYIIIGHSERRMYFHEDNALLKLKVIACLKNDMIPVFCCGEVLAERETEIHFEVIKKQLMEGLFHLESDDILQTVIAYEPVWAIGTGKTASPAQAQEMHAFIRELLVENYGDEIASEISILYGGSCNPSNARELFSQSDVDGGLIGGASLKAADFVNIIKEI